MIVYNVTVQVDKTAASNWVEWMQLEHIPEILALDLFHEAKLFRLLEQDETESITYVAQYASKTYQAYESYIQNHAPAMREKGLAKFAGKFIAMRTVMELV
jgi:hypothetical protein